MAQGEGGLESMLKAITVREESLVYDDLGHCIRRRRCFKAKHDQAVGRDAPLPYKGTVLYLDVSSAGKGVGGD